MINMSEIAAVQNRVSTVELEPKGEVKSESSLPPSPYFLYVALDLRSLPVADYRTATNPGAVPPAMWARFPDTAAPGASGLTDVYRLTADLWVRILNRLAKMEEQAKDADEKRASESLSKNTHACYFELCDRLGIILDYVRDFIDQAAIAKAEANLKARGGKWAALAKPDESWRTAAFED